MQMSETLGVVRLRLGNEVERADQQQLIEEIVLEPENDRFVSRAGIDDPSIGCREPLLDLLVRRVAAIGQKPRAQVVPRIRRRTAGAGPSCSGSAVMVTAPLTKRRSCLRHSRRW
jgi:hypothetical protein